jgi:SAM-dependent methyltransferase
VDVAECGCGYGTFTVPVAKAIRGTLFAYDIDPEMVSMSLTRAGEASVVGRVRDVVDRGFDELVDAVLLFNILHGEDPVALLRQARAALRPGGRVLAIHWRHDPATPRGPSMAIRPTPERMAEWAERAGLSASAAIDLPLWHYGMELTPTVAVD